MLSMKAKYALRALSLLAQQKDIMYQIKDIAEQSTIPRKFLEAILLDLKNHGLVGSKRGVTGGYFLTRLPEEIMVGEIIRVLDGPLAPIRCASITAYQKCHDCKSEQECAIRKLMIEVRNAISGVLDTTPLSDIAKDENFSFDHYHI